MSEELESAQKEQKKIGEASSNPKTTGPTENLREKADENEDSEEPA